MQTGSNLSEIRKDLASLLIFIGAVLMLADGVLGRVVYARTPSVEYRFFFIVKKSPSDVKKGDYVLFRINDRYFSTLAVKRVSCTEGEVVWRAGRDFYCGNTYMGTAKEHSLKGERLEAFLSDNQKLTLEEGYVFVSGNHRDSYDSRYFGPIKKSRILAVLVPVF